MSASSDIHHFLALGTFKMLMATLKYFVVDHHSYLMYDGALDYIIFLFNCTFYSY